LILLENLGSDLTQIVNKNLVGTEFNSIGNLITHWGNLLNFKSLIYHTNMTQNKARISYPKMPNNMTVVNYMKFTWNTLKTLIHNIYLVTIRIPNSP
jgi:hypothetical protein